MLLKDKYVFQSLPSQYRFHTHILTRLDNLKNHRHIPHLIFTGTPGCGKYSYCLYYLRQLFDTDDVYRMRPITLEITGQNGADFEVDILASHYHYELDAADIQCSDKQVLHNFIVHLAGQPTITGAYRMIIIKHADKLSMDAYHTIRKTMELYYNNCRIIFTTSTLSKIDSAIRSRCVVIRLPSPTRSAVLEFLTYINACEDYHIDMARMNDIIETSGGNVRHMLHMLQYEHECNKKYVASTHDTIEWLATFIRHPDPDTYPELRNQLYNLLIYGMTPSECIRKLCKVLLEGQSESVQRRVYKTMCALDAEVLEGYREIYYLEKLVLTLSNTIQSPPSIPAVSQ